MRKSTNLLLLVSIVLWASWSQGKSPAEDLQKAFEGNHWNEVIQLSQEVLAQETLTQNLNYDLVRMQGAYALFQKDFPHSALLLLSKIPPTRWQKIPQGSDRLVEVMLLMQKKVPMNILPARLEQIQVENVPAILVDEISMAKGRAAYENGQLDESQKLLSSITDHSRYYGQAHYILGTIEIKKMNFKNAQAEFSKVFGSGVFAHSSEMWNEISTQMTLHWGANLKVMMDVDRTSESNKVNELAILAMARMSYAQKDYSAALTYYDRIPTQSQFAQRVQLEKVWTLLAMNRHSEAQKIAADLVTKESNVEAVEATIVRSLTLADAHLTKESREQLDSFSKIYKKSLSSLKEFLDTKNEVSLPAFVRTEIKRDQRILQLMQYQDGLKQEMNALKTSRDVDVCPALVSLAGKLEPLEKQAKELADRLKTEYADSAQKFLEQLSRQAQLIRIENLLEDREALRTEYRNSNQQKEHDQRLALLLEESVAGVRALLAEGRQGDIRLEFRQSELLWELGKAQQMLAQDEKNDAKYEQGEELKRQSILMAEKVVAGDRTFEKRPQALFFIGFAKMEMGKLNEGFSVFQKYVADYPQHVHVPDAYRIMADLKFDANDFRTAEDLYRKILNFPSSPVVGYAFYKIGWCAYNKKDFSRSLLGLEKAYDWAANGRDGSQWLTLQGEARRDLINIFSEIGDHKKAKDYFDKFVKTDVSSWLVDLAKGLDQRGQFEKSGDIYKLIISMYPDAAENLLYQAAIIQGYHQLSQWDKVLAATNLLIERYRSQLQVVQADGTLAARAEQIVREAVMGLYFEFKKRSSLESEERVQAMSESYLSAFVDWPQAQALMYTYAHFLAGKKQNLKSAELFLLHWKRFSSTLHEPLREESLRNLISAYDIVSESEKAQLGQPLSQSSNYIIQFSEVYEKEYPKTSSTRKIVFLRAAAQSKFGNIEAAMSVWQKLFDINSTDEIGKLSFNNLRSAYYQKKNWDTTYKWATSLYADKAAGFYQKELQIIREESYFLLAEQMPSDALAADQFEKIANDSSLAKLREKSLFNAFIHSQKSGQRLRALSLADELQKDYPDFPDLKSIAGVRAAMYQESGDYRKAFPLLQSFLKFADSSTPAEALSQGYLNAGLIAEALNEKNLAVEYLQAYFKKTPSQSQGIPTAQQALTRLQRGSSNLGEISVAFLKLSKLNSDFKSKPILPHKDLAEQIRKSLVNLENLVKKNSDFSANEKSDADEAFEAFCMNPISYDIASRAILKLGDKRGLAPQEKSELHSELIKVSDPLDQKARELAETCITKSIEAEHVGPIFLQVINKWRFLEQPEVKLKLEKLTHQLKSRSPWFDPFDGTKIEEDILKAHQESSSGTEDSWYALARIRWERGLHGLSRLTLVDALNRFPKSGKILNAIAVEESVHNLRTGKLFSRAMEMGSRMACANLALYHLEGARILAAKEALKNCLEKGSFNELSDLKLMATEYVSEKR